MLAYDPEARKAALKAENPEAGAERHREVYVPAARAEKHIEDYDSAEQAKLYQV